MPGNYNKISILSAIFSVYFTFMPFSKVLSAVTSPACIDTVGNSAGSNRFDISKEFYGTYSLRAAKPDTTTVIKTPRGAMIRSAIFPGWGQWYNGKKIKSIIIFAAESGCIGAYFYEQDRLNDVSDILNGLPPENDPQHNEKLFKKYTDLKEDYRDKRNKYAWWFAGVVIYSMVDAYVDTYLSTFDVDMDINVKKSELNTFISVSFKFSPIRFFQRRK